MRTYISGACAAGHHNQDDLPNGSRFGSIPPCSCDCHTDLNQIQTFVQDEPS